MNILYVVHYNGKGGAALSFLEMISLVSKEHNVYVVVPHKEGFIPQQLDKMGIPYLNAHYFWWKIAVPHNKVLASLHTFVYKFLNIWNYVEAHKIKKIIFENDIDIIHSNSSVINFGALLSKNTGIPHVWHLREYGEEDFELKRIVPEKIYLQVSSYATAYIAISKSIMEKFTKVVDENKIFQIYNGVSEKFCFEKEFSYDKNGNVKFLIAGNYCKEKGQIDVIKAAVELHKQAIDKFEIYLAGSGDFAEPKRLVAENGLEKHVNFCGLVDDMLQLRKKVDVEIVASKCEAFGRVTIEAMRMSNPVIGTNVGGTPELITDGFNGFLFDYGDYMQLAEYMKQFICDSRLIRVMGRNAYLITKNMFTPRENARNVLNIYEKIQNNTL